MSPTFLGSGHLLQSLHYSIFKSLSRSLMLSLWPVFIVIPLSLTLLPPPLIRTLVVTLSPPR